MALAAGSLPGIPFINRDSQTYYLTRFHFEDIVPRITANAEVYPAMNPRPVIATLMLVFLAGRANAQNSNSWHDPSPHTTQFVTVDTDVKLEVLDWGGTGQPLVLLTGLGNTAHVFDDFAPNITFMASRGGDMEHPVVPLLDTPPTGSATMFLRRSTHSRFVKLCLLDIPLRGRS